MLNHAGSYPLSMPVRDVKRQPVDLALPLYSAQPKFRLEEKIVLIVFLVSLVMPYRLIRQTVTLSDISSIIFVLVSLRYVKDLYKPFIISALLFIPLIIGSFLPYRNTGLHTYVATAKIIYSTFFIYNLWNRCRNIENAFFLITKGIIPIALLYSITAIHDKFTSNTFYTMFRLKFYHSAVTPLVMERYGGSDLAMLRYDQLAGGGLALRTSDIPPWVVTAMACLLWLRAYKPFKRFNLFFIPTVAVLIASTATLPKRSAVVTVGAGLIFFILMEKRLKLTVRILLLITGLMAFQVGGNYAKQYLFDSNLLLQEKLDSRTAFSRFKKMGVTAGGTGARYTLFAAQIKDFQERPRLLLVGSGWDFGAGIWRKPHNTFIGILVGGGVFSLFVILIAVALALRRNPENKSKYTYSNVGIALLLTLIVEMNVNGYAISSLEYGATNMFVFFTIIFIINNTPIGVKANFSNETSKQLHR